MKHQLISIGLAFALSAAVLLSQPPSPEEQITNLRREIARHDELYHRKAAPEIDDAAYDGLRQRLSDLESRFPAAARAAPPLATIGDDRSGRFATFRHRAPMLSLEKAYRPAELRAFHQRLVRILGRTDLEYVIEPKYDGLAVSVTFEHGRLVQALTRGNGAEGDDITANLRRIPDFPHRLRASREAPLPELIEIRGEIHVPHGEFARVNAEQDAAGKTRFASPRNLAAGTIRQLDGTGISQRGLSVVFFGIGACEPAAALPQSQTSLRAHLQSWGMPVVGEFRIARGVDALIKAVTELGRARASLPFPTDGAVIKLNSTAEQRAAGATDAAPRWAIAYKFAPERAETQLRAITLQVGRTGVLTPVAELVPVEIGGSKLSRATLHNREEIERKDIRVGDFVFVEKAGEVIPAIVGVNLARRPPEAQPFTFPITCPSCYAGLVSDEGKAAVRCPNEACPAQVRRRIEHFASKECVAIEGLGPAMVEKLAGTGWVRDVPDLYRLRRADLITLGRDNRKSVDQLLAAIERSKTAELWRIIHGIGLPDVGTATAKELARQCKSLRGLVEEGSDLVPALGEQRYQRLIAELIELGVSPLDEMRTPRAGQTARPLAGRVFVLTGTLPNLSRAGAIARIEAAGGTVAAAVSRKTHYVVAGAGGGAKLDQARVMGVAIIDEAALLRLIDGAGVR